MKKLLTILLAFVYLASSAKVFPPKGKIEKFWEDPRYHSTLSDKYYESLNPVSAHDIGWKFGSLVTKSIRIGENLYYEEGFRSVHIHEGFLKEFDVLNFTSWADHVVGTPGSSLQLTTMTGYVSGDRALVRAGLYPGGNVSNLIGITVIPQTTRLMMNAELAFRNVNFCELAFITWTGFTGAALDMRAYGPPFTNGNGPIRNCYIHNISFIQLNAICIDANGGLRYTFGDTTTSAWYKVTIDSVFEDSCNALCQGSFGAPSDNSGSPPNVFDLTTITRFYSIATSSTSNEGTEIRGIQFRCNYNHWIVVNLSGRGNSGDDGLVYGHGNGMFSFIYKYGGPGYIDRLSPCKDMLLGPAAIWVFCNLKANGGEYGLTCEQQPDSVAGKCSNIDSAWICFNTAVNLPTHINYWCQLAVLGTRGWPRYQVRSNLAINIADAASNGAGHDNGTWTQRVVFNQGEAWPTESQDTSNNQYWQNTALALIDTLTPFTTNRLGTFPTYGLLATSRGHILHGGVANAFVTTDFAGHALRTPPDIGYLQLQTSTGGATNYLAFPRKVRKTIVSH